VLPISPCHKHLPHARWHHPPHSLTLPPSFLIRAVAWYLHAGKERSDLDGQQWKSHSEELEGRLAEGQAAWASKEQHFEQQIKDIHVSMQQGRASTPLDRRCGF